MKLQHVTKIAASLLLLTLFSTRLHAQVSLPVPDQDVGELVAVLDSDDPLFQKAKACQQLAIIGTADAVPALAALLSDERLSTYARSALEVISGPEADQALRDAAKTLTGDRLLGVLHSLGKRHDTESIPLLADLLARDDQAIQSAAARALGEIGTPGAAALLRKSFSEASGESRLAIAKGCLQCAQRLADDGRTQQAASLCTLLRNADLPRNLHWAATYSAIQAQGTDGVALLLELLDSDDPAQFRVALQAARELGHAPSLSTELASRLDGRSTENQALLLVTLGELGDKRVLPAVLKAAKHGAPQVRVAGIGALARLGDESCATLLLQAAASVDEAVADAARAAIVQLEGGKIDAAVVAMLDADNSRAVLSAIEIASRRNIASVTPILLRLAAEGDASTRKAAIQALGQTATLGDLPDLVNLVIDTRQSEESAIAEKSLKEACVRMPQEECVEALVAAMPKVPSDVRVVLLDQLAVVGGTAALEAVVEAAESSDDAMQDAATRLLGEWLTADAAPPLLEFSKTLTNDKYQIRALRGYIRIARQLDMTTSQRMEVCRNALAIADRNDEKELVLDVLKRYPTPEGLAMAKSLLENEQLRGAARGTIWMIREAMDASAADETGFAPLFDGKTLTDWRGDMDFWRVKDGAIVGGSLTEMVEHNQFLRTKEKYGDFELRLQFQLLGDRTNAGVQIRTEEIPNHHEVRGYQADLGNGYWGCLYDEARRRKVLAGPEEDERAKPVRVGEWNDHRIRCEGRRIQIWINGVQTVDYTEQDRDIPQTGIIALQVHGKYVMEAWYRNIHIKEL